MKIFDAIRFITLKITLKLVIIIFIVIGLVMLILGILLYILRRFESEESLTSSEYSSEAYTDISNTNQFAYTIVQSPSVGVLPSESEIAPQTEDYLATCAAISAKENKDVVGWISIEGIPVDCPVVQAEDNTFYLKHDADGNISINGAIFLDYRCDPISLTGISILYGHHMKDGSMFASLVKYKDEKIFKNNPIIEFATLEKTYQWQIFSVLITDPSYDYLKTEFSDIEHYLAFITGLQANSIFETGIFLSESDDILILSTCTYEYENARFVIVAKKIQ